ncbi:site-specific DNA-methyltransferase [Aestuariicoccus sp. MJ-SS9]|uniref:site-specific DNA-methyltransferase n=1 Tax=Aestuariicoccus sp. MJ-SS9 TaxID=3079855 RepID=UPI0029126A9C|nr:DNA methyltransferase [Aestuariicoccus sp. MJ-SS9]MDU8912501.1 DNA methyltransferase [Aestuariicoccus sp. MJ-SS9]
MSSPNSPAVHSPDTSKRNDLAPMLELKEVPLDSLEPPKNPVRKHNKKQVQKVARSIKQFGNVVPLLIAGSGEIIDGVSRYQAAKQLGLATIPCIQIDHLEKQEVRLLRVTLNKIATTGEFDPLALKIELAYQLEFGTDVTITGFEPAEIDSILEFGVSSPSETDPLDDFGNPSGSDAPAVTRTGDLWLLGKHRVLCASARDGASFERLLQSDSPSLLLTDPPYNVPINGHVRSAEGGFAEFTEASGEMTGADFTEFLVHTLSNGVASLAKGGLTYCFMDWRHIDELREAFRRLDLEQINLAVWVKTNGGMGSLYRSRHELVFIGKRRGEPHLNNVELGKHGRNRTNVWEYGGATGGTKTEADDFTVHPTVKPVALLQDVILDVTKVGDQVLDPFLGSGSTLLAAERAGRACLGMDISPAYVDVTIDRWQRLTGLEALHAETGLGFAIMQDRRHETDCSGSAPQTPGSEGF